MDPILLHAIESCPLVAMLLGAIAYFHKRDVRNERRAEERHVACEQRNERLQRRIEALEERQFERLEELAVKGIAGLAESTAAIKRVLRDPVTPPHPLPAISDHHHKDRP